MSRTYTADQAVKRLGIAKQSLYAYVSRGKIRAVSASGRRKQYSAEDVDALWRAQRERHHPERAAASALDWHGHPVLPTSLSAIERGELCYRGRSIGALLDDPEASLEAIAALLWEGDERAAVSFPLSAPPLVERALSSPAFSELGGLKRAQIALCVAEHEDLGAQRLDGASVRRSGSKLVGLMLRAVETSAPCARPAPSDQASAAKRFALALGQPSQAALCATAMALCAEHGLNASTFAARVAASTRASPYGAAQAGLAALMGQRHVGTTLRIDAWMSEVLSAPSLKQGLSARLRRGESWPGLGHALYPEGDPRAALLLKASRDAIAPRELEPYEALLEALQEHLPDLGRPSIDLMLVVMMRAMGRGAEDALALFAVARSVGWVAHALEEYARDAIIRPRASYSPSQ